MIDFETAGERESFLSDNCPPMGIYETLYAFRDAFAVLWEPRAHIHGLRIPADKAVGDVRWPAPT